MSRGYEQFKNDELVKSLIIVILSGDEVFITYNRSISFDKVYPEFVEGLKMTV